MAGKSRRSSFCHLVEAVHARGRLFGDAFDAARRLRVPAGLRRQALLDRGEEGGLLFAVGVVEHGGVLLGGDAEVHEQRGVAAVVQDHVRALAARELEDAVGELPVLVQRLALVGEDGRAAGGDGGGGVVLGREDVAGGPAHVGAERLQRLDQHGGLDGHVQRAGDAGAFQRLRGGELLADRHQRRHLRLGDGDLLAAKASLREVGDPVVRG